MRYTKPTIQHETKATPIIMGIQGKLTSVSDNQQLKPPHVYSVPAAYEADE